MNKLILFCMIGALGGVLLIRSTRQEPPKPVVEKKVIVEQPKEIEIPTFTVPVSEDVPVAPPKLEIEPTNVEFKPLEKVIYEPPPYVPTKTQVKAEPVKEVKKVEVDKKAQIEKKASELEEKFYKQAKVRDSILAYIKEINLDLNDIDKRYKERERKEKMRDNPRYRNIRIDSESIHSIDRDYNFKSKELQKAETNLNRCEKDMENILSEIKRL